MKDMATLLKEDALAYLKMSINQMPVNYRNVTLVGESASEEYASKIISVLKYGSLSIDEARNSLNGIDGPHKSEVLRALEILEEKSKKNEE